jgi:HK97 gp10 family phage protein
MPATLKTRLDGIALELQPRVAAAAKAGAEIIAEQAQQNLVTGGHIREDKLGPAVHVEREGAGEYSVVAGDDDVFYGHMLEHGTTRAQPYPFLVPALMEHEDTVVYLVQGALEGL